MRTYFAPQALLPNGWANDVRLVLDQHGTIQSLSTNATSENAERLAGPVMPGMPNLHSHAFQRAMAGLTEIRASAEDDFWSWRTLMYQFLARLNPTHAAAIAEFLYIEMLKCGYTAVAEFHYVHHQPNGATYADPADMLQAHVHAAARAGIAITALPSLYMHGNFGNQALADRQKRFASDPALILQMLESLRPLQKNTPDLQLGVSPHSLRAVDVQHLNQLVQAVHQIDPQARIHMHVSEQTREVDDCLAFCGQRPMQWLLSNAAVDQRWCLIHATHLTSEETTALAQSQAVTGLCPTTEGNLGDGIFPFESYRAQNGRWGIGGDSHVSRDPFEELRLLEYVQRLITRRRNRTVGHISQAVGTTLWLEAAQGGAQALGRHSGQLAPGYRADVLVLDATHPDLIERQADAISNAAIFSGATQLVRDVMVGGRWVIQQGHHQREVTARQAYLTALRALI